MASVHVSKSSYAKAAISKMYGPESLPGFVWQPAQDDQDIIFDYIMSPVAARNSVCEFQSGHILGILYLIEHVLCHDAQQDLNTSSERLSQHLSHNSRCARNAPWERRHPGSADILGAQASWERRHPGSAGILGAQASLPALRCIRRGRQDACAPRMLCSQGALRRPRIWEKLSRVPRRWCVQTRAQ